MAGYGIEAVQHTTDNLYQFLMNLETPPSAPCGFNRPTKCSQGHVHVYWPQQGNFEIMKCESVCQYCGLAVKTAATLRKHVMNIHKSKEGMNIRVLASTSGRRKSSLEQAERRSNATTEPSASGPPASIEQFVLTAENPAEEPDVLQAQDFSVLFDEYGFGENYESDSLFLSLTAASPQQGQRLEENNVGPLPLVSLEKEKLAVLTLRRALESQCRYLMRIVQQNDERIALYANVIISMPKTYDMLFEARYPSTTHGDLPVENVKFYIHGDGRCTFLQLARTLLEIYITG